MIKNATSNPIKAWSARLTAKNAFNKTILETNLESNVSDILPGETESASFIWEDNKFINDETYDKVMATSDENLKLELTDDVVVAR